MTNSSEDLVKQLYLACYYGREKEALDLLKRGVDPNSYYYGRTPLMWACSRNCAIVAQHLIKWGASLSMTSTSGGLNGRTALHFACSEHNMACVQLLMNNHSPTDIVSINGMTAVDLARWKGANRIAEYITTYKPLPKDPLSSYPSSKLLSQLQIKEWFKLGLGFGLTEDQMESMKNSENPTAAMLIAAKIKNDDLKWKDIVENLLTVGEYELAERVCTEQGSENATGDTLRSLATSLGLSDAIKCLDNQSADSATTEVTEHMKEEGKEDHSYESVPVLPRDWAVVTDRDTKKPVYHNSNNTEITSDTPPGYPLHQTSAQPGVIFYDEPQEEVFSSSGGHTDFSNGVEVTVRPNTIPSESTMGITVQPSFAPSDVFVMPEGIESASPSYLISREGSTSQSGEVTLTIEHHVRVPTREEADDLLFLQADTLPKKSDSGCTYEYREVTEGRSEFAPGENKGKLTIKSAFRKFVRVGLRAGTKLKKIFKGSSNLYTLRVYRSPPQTTGDRLCVVIVSLLQRAFFEFLKKFESDVIPREYPALSKDGADKTIKEPLTFAKIDADIKVACGSGWRSVVDQGKICKDSVDLPVTGNFAPEELQCYPPKIVCRFFPEQGAVSTTCTLTMSGFDKPVSVDMALLMPSTKKPVAVDTTKLEEAAVSLKISASKVTIPQLSVVVEKILHFAEMLTSALWSSSLSVLAVHTDSIKTQVKTVLTVSKVVAEECTKQVVSKNIEARLPKIEILSHQLCQVTKVKLKSCQDQLEKAAALADMVDSGANLLKTVDYLLKDIQILEDVSVSITEQLPLAKVEEATKEVCSDWYSLAVELGISHRVRKATERNHSSLEARFYAILRHWVRRTAPPPSWSALVRALKSVAINRGDIAKEIEAKLEEIGKPLSDDVMSTRQELCNPQGPLSVDKHLKMVRDVTWDVRSNWYALGLELGLNVGTLKVVKRNLQNESSLCYTCLLEHWLTESSPPPTWSVLIEALKTPAIGHVDIASKIETMLKGN